MTVMERTGLAVLMVLTVALMRVVDGDQEATGGRSGDLSKAPTTGQSTTLRRMPRGASAPAVESAHVAGASGEDPVSTPQDRAQRTARHPQRSRVNRGQSSKPGSSSTRRLTGPNVCGGQQCCSGWAVAPGTNRCIK
ncbi:hypothetical protein CHARACLAT_014739, partial [Characodon lateralis]|nr:hypothetical protein [Characodon lateralis]